MSENSVLSAFVLSLNFQINTVRIIITIFRTYHRSIARLFQLGKMLLQEDRVTRTVICMHEVVPTPVSMPMPIWCDRGVTSVATSPAMLFQSSGSDCDVHGTH